MASSGTIPKCSFIGVYKIHDEISNKTDLRLAEIDFRK